jgi:hypothetical protein
LVEFEEAVGGLVPTEGGGVARTGIAEAGAHFRLEVEGLEGGGDGLDGFGIDEEGGVADDFGQAGDLGGDGGGAEAHRLEGGKSESFGEGGEDEGEAVLIEPGEGGIGDVAGGEDAVVSGEGEEELAEAGTEPAFPPGEDEVGAAGVFLAEVGPGVKEAREVLAGLEGGDGKEEVAVGEAGEFGGASGELWGGGETAGEGDGGDPVFGVVGEDVEELAAAELGDGDDEVGAEAGVEGALEAAEAVRLLAPIGVDEEVEIVEGPDEAGIGEAGGGEKAVEVEEVRVAEAGFEGLGVMAPEAAGVIEGGESGAEAPVEVAGACGVGAPVGVEEEVTDDGVEDELVGRAEAIEGAEELGGDDAAAGFAEAGLADVVADFQAGPPLVGMPAARTKAAAYWAAISSRVGAVAAWARDRRERVAARPDWVQRDSMDPARERGERGSKKRAASPATSRRAVRSELRTGRPRCMASMMGIPKPS